MMSSKTFLFKTMEKIIALCCLLVVVLLGTCASTARYTASPHPPLTFSLTNFSSQSLLAEAVDLSDPANILFQLQNGSSLWYGIALKSLPAGLLPSPANPSGDLIAATFFTTAPLLPPAQLLPFDQQRDAYIYERLQLQVALSGPGQMVQLTLSPLDPHAVTLDLLNLLLNLLGQHTKNISIGLLAPGTLPAILALATTMKDFQALIKNYTGALRGAANADQVRAYALQCASNIAALLNDSGEQGILADVLWKMQGKAISNQNILTTLAQFATLPFALAITDSITTMVTSLSSTLLQKDMPVVTIQTAPIITPTPMPSPTPIPTPTPMPSPTPVPTPTPSPLPPTPIPAPSPTAAPTPLPIPTPSPTPIPTPLPQPTPTPSPHPKPSPTRTIAPAKHTVYITPKTSMPSKR